METIGEILLRIAVRAPLLWFAAMGVSEVIQGDMPDQELTPLVTMAALLILLGSVTLYERGAKAAMSPPDSPSERKR